mmetsp:Transcript_36063/g.84204  ORF Transcript_36063/g.84204 Transcript_36063/m.84204 type:complete len:288 (-) Transcript_36063:278-1141(-)
MALMKTLDLMGKERHVVARERMRRQYSGGEYLAAKMLAEFPLDAGFSVLYAALLKRATGLRVGTGVLCGTLSLVTVACAALGFAVGSFAPDAETAMTMGMPLMIIYMVVGVINPGGVNPDDKRPIFLDWLKMASPVKWGIEALCVAEFKGMEFEKKRRWFRILDTPRMGGLALVNNGDEVLESLGLKDLTWKNLMRNLGILVLVELGVSLVGLNVNGPRFIEANQKEKVENDGCVSNTRKFRTKKNFSERVEGSNKMDESSIRSKGSIPAANRAISKAFQVDVSGVL